MVLEDGLRGDEGRKGGRGGRGRPTEGLEDLEHRPLHLDGGVSDEAGDLYGHLLGNTGLAPGRNLHNLA